MGAEVYTHEFTHLNARFTMNYYEPMRKCTRVTIGTPNDNIKGGYINEPYDYESSPRICDLCWELFELIKISAKKFK